MTSEQTANRRKALNPSIALLVAANTLPLIGVMHWQWSAFQVVIVYWLENLIIGFINVLKMITCSPYLSLSRIASLSDDEKEKLGNAVDLLKKHGGKLHHAMKLLYIPFFIVHYGGFCLGHGFFIFVMLGPAGQGTEFANDFPSRGSISDMMTMAFSGNTIWAALGIFVSHLTSFFVNYIGKGEFRRAVVPGLMMAPYKRIAILHIAIVFGAFLIEKQGSPLLLLALLVIGKTILDWKLHTRSHRRLQKSSTGVR